jgi:hypothetical protein
LTAARRQAYFGPARAKKCIQSPRVSNCSSAQKEYSQQCDTQGTSDPRRCFSAR